MTLTGSSSGSTASDGSGNYTFASLASGGTYTVTPTKTALPPGSTGINTVDVIATQRHFLNIALSHGCRLTAADVNGDATVNTVDVIAIQRFFLGLSTGIANVGKYQFSSGEPHLYGNYDRPDRAELRYADLRRRCCRFCLPVWGS